MHLRSNSRGASDAGYVASFHVRLATKQARAVRREEYLDHMTFQTNARPLFGETFGPITGLKEEWKAQGAAPGELDLSAFRYRDAREVLLPVNTGWMGGDPVAIMEETDGKLVYRDNMGRRMELSKLAASLALPMTHPVESMDDWLAIKHHYEFDAERLATDWKRIAMEEAAAGHLVSVGIPGGFDEPRQLMGEEALAIACYEQPEVIHDVLATIGETALRVLEAVTRAVQVDQLCVHEDMAGCSGPLFGPKQVEEFIAPYYRRIWEMVRERGVRVFKQDSDGDMRPVIPAFLNAGINVIGPCEPVAGMDIVKLREQYGRRLAFVGGLDKHVLRRSREEIVRELETKIPPMVKTGGCVLGLDHRIPNGTPLENYRFYIRKAWEILDRETAAA